MSSSIYGLERNETSFAVYDVADTTKEVLFDAGGTTATSTTLAFAQTANRTITFPDGTGTVAVTGVDTDFGTADLTTGGKIVIDVDGTAINADGSITFGVGNDDSIYHDGTSLTLDCATSINAKVGGVSLGTWDAGGIDIVAGDTYAIAGTDVLTATTLGSGVVSSSLTSVGTLSTLTVTGDVTIDTNTLFVDASADAVGINTTGPDSPLQVNGRVAVLGADDEVTTNIASGFSNNNHVVSRGGLNAYRDTSVNGTFVSGLVIANTNNSADSSTANAKALAAIGATVVTSDSNAGQDSGGDMVFYTKPEAGAPASVMTLDSTGDLALSSGSLTLPTTVDFSDDEGARIMVETIGLSDDTAGSFTARGIGQANCAIYFISSTYARTTNGIFTADGSAVPVSLGSGSDIEFSNSALSGTTGTDGKLTVSTNGGSVISIENRLGSARRFTLMSFAT
jgi:hypothetical protein